MVENVLSLTRSGLRDWIIQRVTAVVLLFYFLCITGFLWKHTPLTYPVWQQFFMHSWMKVFSFLALLSLGYHAWIGIWTIATDYLKCVCVRSVVYLFVALALLVYFAWGLQILWGL